MVQLISGDINLAKTIEVIDLRRKKKTIHARIISSNLKNW